MAFARHVATLTLALCVPPACSGNVSSDDPTSSGGEADPNGSSGMDDQGSLPVAPDPTSGTGTGAQGDPTGEVAPVPTISTRKPGEVTRFARLTHEQYDNTIQTLLGIEATPSAAFAPDALNGFAFSSSTDFIVDGRLAPQYRTSAEALAEQVILDATAYAHVVPCVDESDVCRDQFIANFGLRAFRRPLTEAQTTAFTNLFTQGEGLVASGNAFSDGVRVVVEAILQSPQFLYRAELSTEASSANTIALDDYDVASRLSYFIYNSMPDEALFEAAANGGLRSVDSVSEQVARMLEDPRATEQLVAFHEQAWSFNRYKNITPDLTVFPDAPADLSQRALDASRAYLRDVIQGEGGFEQLMTAPFAYADDQLAPLYGAEVEGNLQRIELDPAQRLGLLGQVGFLASHAYAQKTDPIHRGLFVVRELLCRAVPEPPPGAAQAQLPEGSPTPKTTREEVELLTSPDSCAPCHRVFNPMGFAFEGFDAVGQTRLEEDGEPINTIATVELDAAQLEVNGAVDLIHAIAASDEAKLCYAKKWVSFAHGRELTSADAPLIETLTSDLSARAIAAAIVGHTDYLTRPQAEIAQ
jgi:hypothetical protein